LHIITLQNVFLCLCLQEALEAANKAAEELQEQLQQASQAAADEASKAAELHAVEIQKMVLERTKLEVGITYIVATKCQHSIMAHI
jgi:hypothetical protein